MKPRESLVTTLLALAVLAAGALPVTDALHLRPFPLASYAEAADVQLDVPFVPTPQKVVDDMLEVTKVGPDDLLFDLGCGDGRIVITAAKKYGTRGVGVDLNPERIKESKENAAKAGVTDKVRFIEGDLFKVDFKDATVMTLYLLPSVNLRLRPRLLDELRPGTRIVSHDFDMGDWQADQSFTSNERDQVYFWVIPANVSGSWTITEGTGPGQRKLTLSQKYQVVSGTVTEDNVSTPLSQVVLTGNRLAFSVPQKSGGQARFEGVVTGNTLEGGLKGAPGGDRPWKGTREPSSVIPLDK